MNKKAIAYTRVSTDEQSKGYSLQTQLEAIQKYADQCGYQLVQSFKDDYTGASMERPGLNCLREYVTQNPVDRLIVYDIDRLARKSAYQMLIEEELNRRGVLVEYVIGNYADTDEGRLQKQIRASIAEYEKAKIIERMKRGKRGKVKAGYPLMSDRPPYGYQIKSEPHKCWLVVDEAEERIVRLVFEWYLYGESKKSGPLSLQAIAAKLTSMQVPTRGDVRPCIPKKHGYGVWSSTVVRSILTNETLTGIWYYGKTRMMSETELSALGDEKRLERLRRAQQ